MTNEVKILAGIGIATLAIVIGAAFFLGGKPAPGQEAEKITADQIKQLTPESSHRIGNKKAKVTIVEFGDYQCPACGLAHAVVTQLLNEYNGRISFVFRHFPLPMHKNAQVAAMAAEAAGEQGKFFEMHDALYENQKEWSESNNPVDDYFVAYAKKLELDLDKFKSDIDAKKYEKIIQQGITDGTALVINSTPTFFINDEKINGGLPYNEFKEKIDKALAASKTP